MTYWIAKKGLKLLGYCNWYSFMLNAIIETITLQGLETEVHHVVCYYVFVMVSAKTI